MSSLFPTVAPKQPSSGHGHHGTPPFIRGGGDDFRGDGSPDFGPRMRRARFGLLAALVPIFMLFLGIAIAYIWRYETVVLDMRTNVYKRIWTEVQLPVGLLLFNTLLLFLSSLIMEMARRQITLESVLEPLRQIPGLLPAREWKFPWLSLGLLFGVAFLIGQAVAWHVLELRGYFMAGTSGFFYMLTGTHAVHLLGGIVVFAYAQFATITHKSVDHRRIVIDITAWYWHFMLVLWVCIFALLYFLR